MNEKRKLPKSTRDLSQDQLLEILKKKKECNRLAQKIVEALSEQDVDQEWMLLNLSHINQCHYEDVVTERSISKYCGYPLCKAPLGDVPKQQYRISLTKKAVYDITDRKKFCSSNCYRASQHLKTQLFTSPLWFRDGEVVPVFTLLATNDEKIEEDSYPNDEIPHSVTEDTATGDTEISNIKGPEEVVNQDTCTLRLEEQKGDIDKSKERRKEVKNSIELVDPVSKVEKAVEEWFTIHSYIYLLGEEKLKSEFVGKEEMMKSIIRTHSTLTSKTTKFEEISKLFSILNLDGDDSKEPSELKPVPDYKILKTEAENLKIKVRAFYTGQLDMVPGNSAQRKSEQADRGELTGEMPLVDSYAQAALRRRVLLDRLNRVVPDICLSLNVAGLVEIADIRSLVRTFNLSAHNVTFKPREWFLASAVFVKMLSLKMDTLANSLASEESKKRLTLLLMSYDLPPDYLDNLMEWVIDTERVARSLFLSTNQP